MVIDGQIKDISDGWRKLTDMLRARYTCSSAAQVIKALDLLSNTDKAALLRIVPKLGLQTKRLSNLTVNFDYDGKMICEL